MKLSDVFWEAANKTLNEGEGYWPGTHEESCVAVVEVERPGIFGEFPEFPSWRRVSGQSPGVQFMKSLGCKTGGFGFKKYERGEERQAIRYMWLLLAMHVAEDEGL